MRRVFLLAKRDYLESIKTKAFIVGLVVAPMLFGGGFLGMALMRAKPDIKDRRIALLDRTGVAAPHIMEAARIKNGKDLYAKGTHRQVTPRYAFEIVKPEPGNPDQQRLRLSEAVRRGEYSGILEIWPDALRPPADAGKSPVGYYSNSGGIDETRQWLADPVNNGLRRARLAQLGVAAEHYEDVLGTVPLDTLSLVAKDEKTGEIRAAHKRSDVEGFAVPFGFTMLLGMIVMVGSSPMLPAVTEDKAQRVVEMLLGVASPFELMAGKVIAAIARSLTSSAFYVLGATLALQGLALLGAVPFSLFPWFYVYLIADVTMLSAFAVALGAACSTPQDAQNLAVLLVAPVVIPFFVLVPMLTQPNGSLATTMSLIPPFTPMLMLLRQAMPGGVPAWQPWVGLAGILAFTMMVVWAAARIFRIGILMQGKTPNLAELVRWAVRG